MKNSTFLFLILLVANSGFAQKLRYEVSFPNAIHHEAEISLIASQMPRQPITFRMSRSSPGRYATHEFGKNVYNVKAFNADNQPIPVNRIDGDVYEVPQHTGYIKISYTLYGNYADGTYLGIDPQSIHLNMPATFMWAKGFDRQPIEVKFTLPAENAGKVATQLVPAVEPYTFTAPGLQYFMDSPTKIGQLHIKEWQRPGADAAKPITFRLALEAAVPDSTAETFAKKVAKVVDEARAVFGEFPAYDYGNYTFIASLNPYVKGDGMEHRNSTMITSATNFQGQDRALSTFSHEFFHCWNVERIRPQTLEPFNFEKSNMSNELWFAEGFTQYYGGLLLVRSGFVPVTEYMGTLTGMINTKMLAPGATHYSPIDASRHGVFTDAATAIDPTNFTNMFTSYYTYGAAIALALDLELRQRFNKSLDDYMQAVWKRFGKPEHPYTVEGLQDELGQLTNKEFGTTFFNKYVYGHEAIDYAGLLAKAGLSWQKASAGQAWIGTPRFVDSDKGLTIATNTVKGTPLYNAGLDAEDVITAVNSQSIATANAFIALLNQRKPGDMLTVNFLHRGEAKTTQVVVQENPNGALLMNERTGTALTPENQQFRANWLGTKATK